MPTGQGPCPARGPCGSDRLAGVLVDPVQEAELARVQNDQACRPGVVNPGGSQDLQRTQGGLGLHEQFGLEWSGDHEPLDGTCEFLVPVVVGDAGPGSLDEHVQSAPGRHEEARGLAALARKRLDARQPAALHVEEFGQDCVRLPDGIVRVGDEHRGLELGLRRPLPAAGPGADDRAQEQARRRALGSPGVQRADDPVGAGPVEFPSGTPLILSADDVCAGDLPVVRLRAGVDDETAVDNGLTHGGIGQRQVAGADEQRRPRPGLPPLVLRVGGRGEDPDRGPDPLEAGELRPLLLGHRHQLRVERVAARDLLRETGRGSRRHQVHHLAAPRTSHPVHERR